LLNLIDHKKEGASNTYAKIASISPIVKGMEKLVVNSTEIPAWIINKKNESIESQSNIEKKYNEGITDDGFSENDDGDDLPF
jgi:hypothetical protein